MRLHNFGRPRCASAVEILPRLGLAGQSQHSSSVCAIPLCNIALRRLPWINCDNRQHTTHTNIQCSARHHEVHTHEAIVYNTGGRAVVWRAAFNPEQMRSTRPGSESITKRSAWHMNDTQRRQASALALALAIKWQNRRPKCVCVWARLMQECTFARWWEWIDGMAGWGSLRRYRNDNDDEQFQSVWKHTNCVCIVSDTYLVVLTRLTCIRPLQCNTLLIEKKSFVKIS